MKPRWWTDHKDAFVAGAAGFAVTSALWYLLVFL